MFICDSVTERRFGMEGGGGGEVRAGSGRRRITLLDQMSATADGRELTGLTLDDILRSGKQTAPESPPPPPPEPPTDSPSHSGRTLLDIIRDEDPKASSCKEFVGNRDRKSWRTFKDRLRLNKTGSGAAWTSSVHIPASDILSPRVRSQLSRRSSVTSAADSAHNTTHLDDTSSQQSFRRPQISLSRRSSCRFGHDASFASDPTENDGASDNNSSSSSSSGPPPSQASTLRHQLSRRHSTRYSSVIEEGTDPTEPLPPRREGSRRLSAVLAEERSLSAREAVAAQEAAEAAAAAAAGDEEESTAESAADATPEEEAGQQPVRMSLMDLLEETDRQMGLVGSRYMIGDEDDDDYEEEEEEVEEDAGGGGGGGGVEQNCCVCMVRHKGAAFIPCGHTFCRLCSRELWVSRGNCPLCNGFILEILDIF